MPVVGQHDYSGACDPDRLRPNMIQETFSVGVFEWVERANGDGLKKSKVKVRIRGLTDNPDVVYRCAKEVCGELDSGAYSGPKTITLF